MADSGGNRSGGGKGGRNLAVAGIAALLLLFGGRGFLGFGTGTGAGSDGSGGSESVQQEAAEPSADEKEAAEASQGEEASEEEAIPDVIVVSIKQDKVTINGHEVANQDELRQYVEEYNSDSRTFTLEEDQSILETYNWVKAVFDELDIQLKNSK